MIGTGADGEMLKTKLNLLGIDGKGVLTDSNRPTTRKTRIIAANQQMLRIDREIKTPVSQNVYNDLLRFLEQIIPETDVILISDYGKGVITPEIVSRIVDIANIRKKITIADPKGLDFSKYKGVTLLTPNKKEASLACGLEITGTDSLKAAADRIMDNYRIDNLLITQGKDGMDLFRKGIPPYHIRANARQVFDVSGAGDTVVSVMGLALAAGVGWKESAQLANTAAGIVVGKVGTATVTPAELFEAMDTDQNLLAKKQKTLAELSGIVWDQKQKNHSIVLTNGCFDLLHAGHINLFSESKKLGDILIVALDDDASVRKLKGPGRPVLSAGERVKILSALDSIDYVIVFSSDGLNHILETLEPDVLTKGSNYSEEEVAGGNVVKSLGGRVVRIPLSEGGSSSTIIHNIQNAALK